MFSALFLIFILAQDVPSYYLVIKPGKLLEVQAEPRYEGKSCYFVLPDGEQGMLPIDAIDRERTTSYNAELEEKRRQELEAQEAVAAETTQPEEPAVIEITHKMQIPAYEREATEVATSEVGGAIEIEGMVGQPKEMSYTNTEDAFYISKETIIRLTTGYRIECQVMVNHPRGVSDATVTLTAHFSGGETEKVEQGVQPRSILHNNRATVAFDLSNTNDLLSVEYNLIYAVGADVPAQAE